MYVHFLKFQMDISIRIYVYIVSLFKWNFIFFFLPYTMYIIAHIDICIPFAIVNTCRH